MLVSIDLRSSSNVARSLEGVEALGQFVQGVGNMTELIRASHSGARGAIASLQTSYRGLQPAGVPAERG